MNREGIKYLIEHKDTPMWLTSTHQWTTDSLHPELLCWDEPHSAHGYIRNNIAIVSDGLTHIEHASNFRVTEHEYITMSVAGSSTKRLEF